ncbi:T9SS type A sorting domain-containing protein [bacterium SCSIO 12741]|nr:T9SS type A sorting domain-containing protein [bacterium SCSIO 12741]
MKHFGLVFLCLVAFSGFAQDKKEALFLGNSYTFGNNLPQLIEDIAQSKGDTFIHDSHTPGGYRLRQHAGDATGLGKISARPWDYVIVQAQSQEPSFPASQVQSEVFPYAKQLADSIHNSGPCAKTVFFMTWGRKNGDAQNCQFYPPLCTYDGMQMELRKNYVKMALDNDAWVAPVGMAWKYARDNWPALELYTQDESHPNLEGSYLAACTFYAVLFNKSPIGASYPAGMQVHDADSLQKAAFLTVFDSIPTWNIIHDTAEATFTVQVSGDTVKCFSAGSRYDSLFWDFNDGTTSQDVNPVHIYTTSGNHRIDLEARTGCVSASAFEDVEIKDKPSTVYGIEEAENGLILYPNPTTETLVLESEKEIKNVQILDASGKQFQLNSKKTSTRIEWDVTALPTGSYFLIIESQDGWIRKEFIKK